MVVITVRFAVQAGSEDHFLARVRAQARTSLDAEAECLQFDVCRIRGMCGDSFLYEVYVDDAAFAAHLQSPHYRAFDAETRFCVMEKIVERWERSEPA